MEVVYFSKQQARGLTAAMRGSFHRLILPRKMPLMMSGLKRSFGLSGTFTAPTQVGMFRTASEAAYDAPSQVNGG